VRGGTGKARRVQRGGGWPGGGWRHDGGTTSATGGVGGVVGVVRDPSRVRATLFKLWRLWIFYVMFEYSSYLKCYFYIQNYKSFLKFFGDKLNHNKIYMIVFNK
jgi:hypothetical protein